MQNCAHTHTDTPIPLPYLHVQKIYLGEGDLGFLLFILFYFVWTFTISMYTFYNHFLNYAFVILFIIIFKEKRKA